MIKADGSDKKNKVFIGSPQRCSCTPPGGELCAHILFVMLRVFKVDVGHEVVWQKSLSDAEVQGLLNGTLSSRVPQRRAVEPKKKGQCVTRRVLDESAECPVCCEAMDVPDTTTWCRKGCGNSIHVECMREWAQHNGNGAATCPYCRVVWGTVRGPRKKSVETVVETHSVQCKQCQNGQPIAGPRFACTRCPNYNLCGMCAADPLVHSMHPFQVYATPATAPREVNRDELASTTLRNLAALGVHGTGLNASRGLSTANASPPARKGVKRSNPARVASQRDAAPQMGVSGQTVRRGSSSHPAGGGSQGTPAETTGLLTQDEIYALPVTQWLEDAAAAEVREGGGGVCPTCVQPFSHLDVVRTLPVCGHILHSHCADFHLSRVSALCPDCSVHVHHRGADGEGEGAGVHSGALVLSTAQSERGGLLAPERLEVSGGGGGGGGGAAVAPSARGGGGGGLSMRVRGGGFLSGGGLARAGRHPERPPPAAAFR